MNREIKKIAIVMDEIDGMNNGDKGGITALIKLIRQKKTKKQRLENTTQIPIICIGNYFVDKKIKELMKVCHIFELKSPTPSQVVRIVNTVMPNIRDTDLLTELYRYIQSDIRKIAFIQSIYSKNEKLITINMIRNIFHTKSYNDDSKQIIQKLFESPVPIEEHSSFMNETDTPAKCAAWRQATLIRSPRGEQYA
jgi:replication factor C subunit 1